MILESLTQILYTLDADVVALDSEIVKLGGWTMGSLQVVGIVNSTTSIQLKISNDGSTWVNLGAAIAADGLTLLSGLNYAQLKATVSLTQNLPADDTVVVTLTVK